MKTPHWLVISGLLAATAMAARTEATTIDATAHHAAEHGMDVVVVTAKRPAGRPGIKGLAMAAVIDSAAGYSVPADSPAPGIGIGITSKSELFESAQEAVREAIENLEISLVVR